jgi:hypothetical protein
MSGNLGGARQTLSTAILSVEGISVGGSRAAGIVRKNQKKLEKLTKISGRSALWGLHRANAGSKRTHGSHAIHPPLGGKTSVGTFLRLLPRATNSPIEINLPQAMRESLVVLESLKKIATQRILILPRSNKAKPRSICVTSTCSSLFKNG